MMSIKDLSLDDSQTQILKTCTGEDLFKNNRISDLSDDILISILSLLTLKEAGRTSMLSKRWRHVWSYVPSLRFDASNLTAGGWFFGTALEIKEEEHKYFRWVDQVVSSHKAHTIDEFNIRYGLQDSRHDNIDNWLIFAKEKRVKRLELNITPNTSRNQRPTLPYNFHSLSSFNQLTSLKLDSIQVSGEFLEKFLCDCQTLEVLSVKRSWSLVDFKIVAPPKLKSLKIGCCRDLEHLEISAPNLIHFDYIGLKLRSFLLKSTPKLAEVHIGGLYAAKLMSDFSDLSSCISQLEVLTIDTLALDDIMEVFPVIPRLKMLGIKLYPLDDELLFGISSLIKACPSLQKLVLKIYIESEFEDPYMSRKRIKAIAFRHNHLKILEINGFGGSEVELRFVKYLIRSAVSLEKITIKADSYVNPYEESEVKGREEAKQLCAVLKPGTELEVRGREDQYFWSIVKE